VVTTKTKVCNNRVCTKKYMRGRCTKYRNGCPSVMNAPGEAKLLGNLMKGGGPIGEFLYEVGEMERGSQMGKLMVDEMEGS
jgi:hypothetical protein